AVRRVAHQPQPAALGRCRGRHQAPARDLRRRREVRARCDSRTARRERALLPAVARLRCRGRAQRADLGVRALGARRDPARAAARASRARMPRPVAAGAAAGGARVKLERGVFAPAAVDVDRLRADFPILAERVNGRPLVYLDNGATTQKPRVVIDALASYYEHDNANVHRGVHTLSRRATDAYDAAIVTVQRFVNAASPDEIVFVRGTTEAINLVAFSHARPRLVPGDEIVVTAMEHHSNIVPWQLACEATGAKLVVIPIDDTGALRMDRAEELIGPRTRVVAVTHVSNALGSIVPVARIVELAHRHGAVVLVDGAQAVSHVAVDVQALGCDFYAFSGHKIFGPTGIGVLWGRAPLLAAMPPWQGGGDMIRTVAFEKTTYADPPFRFEAGTP